MGTSEVRQCTCRVFTRSLVGFAMWLLMSSCVLFSSVAGTGGKCHNRAQSLEYGATFGDEGDEVEVEVDLDNGVLRFWANGVAQNEAFSNVPSKPLYPAVSLTATGSVAKLYRL